MTGLQEFEHLIKHAALRHVGQQFLRLDQRRRSLCFQRKTQGTELGGEAHRADDAHRILAVASRRVPNHADDAVFHILEPIVVVHHDLGLRVVIHRIDREIAAHRILFLRAPHVVAQHPSGGIDCVLHAGQLALAGLLVARHLFGRGVVQVGAKGRNFNHLVFATPSKHDMDDAKTPPNDEGTAKQALDLLRRGIGGDIKILGPQTHQQVTHCAAHYIGLVARFVQGAHHGNGAFIHEAGVNAVHLDRHIHPFAEFGLLARQRGGRFAQ